MVYALIDDKKAEKGLFVSFMGGETCKGSLTKELNGLPRKVVFRMECAETQDKEFELNEVGHTQGTTKCELHFKIKTPLACPWYAGTIAS